VLSACSERPIRIVSFSMDTAWKGPEATLGEFSNVNVSSIGTSTQTCSGTIGTNSASISAGALDLMTTVFLSATSTVSTWRM
jgi:hypothetical protein